MDQNQNQIKIKKSKNQNLFYLLNVKQRDQKLCFKLIDVLCKDVKCEAKRSKTIFQCFMSRCLMLSNKPSFDSYAEFALILYYKSAQLCTK